jgi:hypothetical protein
MRCKIHIWGVTLIGGWRWIPSSRDVWTGTRP